MKLYNDKIQIYDIDYNYRNYLFKFDKKVNIKHRRRFSGIIVSVENFNYFIPFTSHPKRKNGKRRNPRTTVEIYNESNELIAALLINNMIPVPNRCFNLVDIPNDRDKDYLNSEYIFLRKEKTKQQIINKAENVYKMVVEQKDEFLVGFCCDFKLLEEKCRLYK